MENINKTFLSVIIPAYNEASRLPATLVDVDRYLSSQRFSYEIIVVNDGSADNTAEIARRFSLTMRNLRLIDQKVNCGKGAAVRTGMLAANGDTRLFMDADNSTAISEVEKLLPYFSSGLGKYDVVFGSRAIKGAQMNPPQVFYKRFAGKLGNFFIQLLLLKGIWDTQCGFKCFSRETAQKIFSLAKINRWGFDAEILALAKTLGYKIKEVPIYWVNNTQSHVSAVSYFQVLLEVIRIRWWLWRNTYKIKLYLNSTNCFR